MSDKTVDSKNSTKIPVPQEFIKEFKSFFIKPKDLDNYDFLLGLNRYDLSSIWKDPDMQVTDVNHEKPIGMKTLDHYFSKKSSSNVKKPVKITDDVKKSNVDYSSKSKSPDSSKRKSLDISNSKSPGSDILSQDIFNKNDSVSSHEYSNQNHDTSEEREVVPPTQYHQGTSSKFNSSSLLSSGQTNQSSSESDDDNKSNNCMITKERNQTKKLPLVDKTKKMSKSSKKSSSDSSSSSDNEPIKSVTKDKPNIIPPITKSPSKHNSASVFNKSREKESSNDSSSNEGEHNSSMKSKKSNKINKPAARSPQKSISLGNRDNNLNKISDDSSSSSDEEGGDISIKNKKNSSRSPLKTNISRNLNRKSQDRSSVSDDTGGVSLSVKMGSLPKMINTSISGNKPEDESSSDSSSSDEELSMNINKPNVVNKKMPKVQQKDILSVLNRSKDKKSSDGSSSDDEDEGNKSVKMNSSIGNIQLKVNSSAVLNKSKDTSSSDNSSSDEEPLMPSGKSGEIKKPILISKDKKSRESSSSSDDCDSSMKMNVSVQKPQLKLNKSKGSSYDSSSSDEESPAIKNKHFSNKTKDKKSSDNSSSSDDGVEHRASVKTNQLLKSSVIDNQLMKLNKSKENKSSSLSSSGNESRTDSVQKFNLSKEKRHSLSTERDKSARFTNNKIGQKGISSSENQTKSESSKLKHKIDLPRKNNSSSSSEDENDSKQRFSVKTHSKKLNSKGSDSDDSKLKDNTLKETMKKSEKTNVDSSETSDDDTGNSKKVDKLISGKNKGTKNLDDFSDGGGYSFKNKDVGKLLGLNKIWSSRNMSCANAIKSLPNKPALNLAPIKTTHKPSTQDSESDSSSTDDDKTRQNNENKISESTIFNPVASSSFILGTPDVVSRININKVESVKNFQQKMEPICGAAPDDRVKQDLKRKRSSVSDSDSPEEKTMIERDRNVLKRKRDSVSDPDSSDKVEDKKFIDKTRETSKRKRMTESGKIESKMDVDQAESSRDVPPMMTKNNSKIEKTNWLENIVKNKKQISAPDKLAVQNSICYEDITEEDEIYSLQCPKDLKIESLIGKKIRLKGESVFDVVTKDGGKVTYESFALSIPSRINLLLPSRVNSSFKLGGFEVGGSLVLSEKCDVPEVDVSAFSSTGKESSSEDELNISTPLPSGLKLRHPLHGLDYKNKAQPNFDLVQSKEEKRKKKRKKHEELGSKDDEFKMPSVPVFSSKYFGESNKLSAKESKKGVVIGRNLISLVSDDESRRTLKDELKKKKKKKHLESVSNIGTVHQVMEPLDSDDTSTKRKKEKKQKKEIMNLEENIILNNVASSGSSVCVDESESEVSKKKKKKKDRSDPEQQKETGVEDDETQVKKKKKKKKERDLY